MSSSITMIENMKRGSLKFWKSLSFPYNTSFWENNFNIATVLEGFHFKLNVLEGGMVSFTQAFLLLAREGGGKDFEHPVYL